MWRYFSEQLNSNKKNDKKFMFKRYKVSKDILGLPVFVFLYDLESWGDFIDYRVSRHIPLFQLLDIFVDTQACGPLKENRGHSTLYQYGGMILTVCMDNLIYFHVSTITVTWYNLKTPL